MKLQTGTYIAPYRLKQISASLSALIQKKPAKHGLKLRWPKTGKPFAKEELHPGRLTAGTGTYKSPT